MSATTDSIAKQVSLLTVTPEEWAAANDYFQKYPAENKYSKKPNVNLEHKGSPHSFIKVGEKIYAMANGKYVGEGGFGKVKVVQAEDGTNFALKIEGVKSRESNQEAQKAREDIAKALNFFEGSVTRNFEQSKGFKIGDYQKNVMRKVYTVMPYLSGHNLWDEIEGSEYKNVSDRDKLQIALQCAKAIKVLHDKGIVHADIKPQNFMINREGGVIIVKAIDFDASKRLESEEFFEVDVYTKDYTAPEVMSSDKYYFKSDIYSLGATLNFLKFSEPSKNIIDKVIKEMCSNRLSDRPSIDEAIAKLEKNLRLIDGLNFFFKNNITLDSILEKYQLDIADALLYVRHSEFIKSADIDFLEKLIINMRKKPELFSEMIKIEPELQGKLFKLVSNLDENAGVKFLLKHSIPTSTGQASGFKKKLQDLRYKLFEILKSNTPCNSKELRKMIWDLEADLSNGLTNIKGENKRLWEDFKILAQDFQTAYYPGVHKSVLESYNQDKKIYFKDKFSNRITSKRILGFFGRLPETKSQKIDQQNNRKGLLFRLKQSIKSIGQRKSQEHAKISRK